MADIQDLFKEAWSQALVGLNAAEAEAEKVLSRLAGAAGLTPDEVKKHAREFGERLSSQRREVERAIDEAVKRAAARVKLPNRDEVEALKRRLDQIAEQLERLAQDRKGRGEGE
ncbi:MAG TPA: phasin family protein [Anaeromyxobacteraceae bacterium]|nr:phasin family protein [Anaeromyxobacteraceae bacterium]